MKDVLRIFFYKMTVQRTSYFHKQTKRLLSEKKFSQCDLDFTGLCVTAGWVSEQVFCPISKFLVLSPLILDEKKNRGNIFHHNFFVFRTIAFEFTRLRVSACRVLEKFFALETNIQRTSFIKKRISYG